MDFGLIGGVNPANPSAESPGVPSFASMEATRYAMGDTRRYAERMNLVAMVPRGDLTSTGFALANDGKEYLVLQPNESSETFGVQLGAGTYSVEWYSISSRETKAGTDVRVDGDSKVRFTAPFAKPGPSVLYLRVR